MLDLPRELPPPPALEDRVVTALAHDGLLREPAPLRRRWWMQTAAAALLFASGVLAGVMWDSGPTPVAPGQPRFLLLLAGGESVSPAEEMRTVEAYRAWAAGLRDAGRFITGQRLSPEAAMVPRAAVEDESSVQGYFIVSAADLADAAAVAQASPHVARGGRIIVRPIDTP
jgi:hypothetical protein